MIFVVTPFYRWKDEKEQLRRNTNVEYHKISYVIAQNLWMYMKKELLMLTCSLQLQTKSKIALSIVETIILFSRQEIVLRGHCDSGPISSELPIYNNGNFRSLLRFCVPSGNYTLNDYLS